MKRRLGRLLDLHPALERAVRLRQRRYRARRDALPDWRALLGDDWVRYVRARARARGGPRILVATSVGAHLPGAILESVLAVALGFRGAEVEVLLCDGVLPACLDCTYKWYGDPAHFVREGPQGRLCSSCHEPATAMFESLGIAVHRYGDWLEAGDRADAARLAAELPLDAIGDFRRDGLSIGEHAIAGALRFFARADLDGEPAAEGVVRRFLEAALLTASAAKRLLDARRFAASVFHHGIYVPQGVIGEVARARGLRVVNWNPAYRQQCFIFSHGDTYHHTLMDEDVAAWEDLPWNESLDRRLDEYLESRWQGTSDWIWFQRDPVFDSAEIAREVGIDFRRPTAGMLTNVAWDAQLHYPANAFHGMHDWMLKTIRWFVGRPDLQLLVRIHPAEITGGLPSRQPASAEIRKAFPILPRNVFVIPPESRASTYAAMAHTNAVIIYGTKTGVELACTGKPVIVAGEAWVRNKGFTIDAATEDDYYRILARLPLPSPLGPAETARARRYGFHFFFRRMIPIRAIARSLDWLPYRTRFSGASLLEPGGCPGLDLICRGILAGSPFIYPAELDPRIRDGLATLEKADSRGSRSRSGPRGA